MFIKFGGRQYSKSYKILCEEIGELELKIEFAKKFNLSYKNEERQLNLLHKKLNGGVHRVQKEENNTNKKTTNKKDENNSWRLF